MPWVAQTGSSESRGSIIPQARSLVAWAAGLVMGLLAVAGWGALAYGIADQQRLSEQAADLRASREQLAEVYVKALEQLAAAQNEVVMLRSQMARLQSQPVSPPTGGNFPARWLGNENSSGPGSEPEDIARSVRRQSCRRATSNPTLLEGVPAATAESLVA